MAVSNPLDTGDAAALYDDVNSEDVPQQFDPDVELGVTGLKRTSGYIDEEFLPALRGRKAVQVFREMANNDPIVGSMLFAIEQLLRNIDFRVVPADQTDESRRAAEFLESCRDDMSHSWSDFITEVLSMLTYGWSWHEIVYKRRLGPWQKDAKKRSKFNDGLIGWRKMPIRSQETLLRWMFDDTGGVQAMVQLAPPRYEMSILPIDKSLLFRPTRAKDNPEGFSLLRRSYRPWYMKKRLEEYEAIGVERDLAGMPVAKLPSEFLRKNSTPEQKAMVEQFRRMVKGVRRDENEGLLLPNQYDPETKMPLFEFELLSSSSNRQFDTNTIIGRYEQRILMTVLADFILVGHEGTGSYSMHTDKTGIFRSAINSIAESIADTLNRHAVTRLFALNGWRLEELPRFEPVDVDPPDLSQLAQFISSTSTAGMQWFPDPDLEKAMREYARLPEMSDETLEFKRDQLQTEQAMMAAESQMGALGMQQKAEMAANGMSPEQAEMASQQPTAEMVAQEQGAQLDADEALADHPARLRQQQEEMAAAQAQGGPGQDPESAVAQRAGEAEIDEKRAQSDHQRTMELEQFKARQTERAAKLQARQKKQQTKKDSR